MISAGRGTGTTTETMTETMTDRTATPANENRTSIVDVFYAMITLGSTTIWSVLSGWLLYFYLPPQGEGQTLVPPALYGGAVFVARGLNAVIAPPIGYLSDRTHTRWGRRLPYMFFSALPMLVFFVLLWTPPVPGNSIWNLLYLMLMLVLYNVTYPELWLAKSIYAPYDIIRSAILATLILYEETFGRLP